MRAHAEQLASSVIDQGKGGTHQARTERDVIVRTALARLEQLDIGVHPLCFGRIDRDTSESFHIGRLGVSDETQEPLVVDWRAPIAEAFYRATGRHPMGLKRRRHFAVRGRQIEGIEDEEFDAEGDPQDDVGIVGSGALHRALARGRSGQMRDIVGTIQSEQDEIIRAPLPGVLVVQGGPGTGKTAVALHRAAYLLYTHRFPLERQGVLVIGPNPVFLRYIEQVLPSLGESGVVLGTPSRLLEDVTVNGSDPPDALRLKGDVRMARAISTAVRDRQRPLREDLLLPFGAYQLRVTAAQSKDIVSAARRRGGSHNGRRRFVELQLADALVRSESEARDRGIRTGVIPITKRRAPVNAEDMLDQFRDDDTFRGALDRMWPVLTPQELLHDLWSTPALIASATSGWLGEDERGALVRRRYQYAAEIPWTAADIPLLDEARVLLGPVRRKEKEVERFGHIVVDEAQDLSPMELRMLARRSLSSSMTVVGDLGQATTPWAIGSWKDVLTHLSPGREGKVVELSISYRTPSEVMEIAERVLRDATPELTPPRAVREAGVHPRAVRTTRDRLVSDVVETVTQETTALAEGTLAVIAPEGLFSDVGDALREAGLNPADPRREGLGKPISLVGLDVVHGLEFDAVVLVEPTAVVRQAGMRSLYVALTRTTKRLAMVHAEELPEPVRLLDQKADSYGA